MKNMMHDIAVELVAMDVENRLKSNVTGRRNWAIRIETRNNNFKDATCGGFGMMDRRGFLSALIVDISKYHIRWFIFTKKKDYEDAIKALENNGYWISRLH